MTLETVAAILSATIGTLGLMLMCVIVYMERPRKDKPTKLREQEWRDAEHQKQEAKLKIKKYNEEVQSKYCPGSMIDIPNNGDITLYHKKHRNVEIHIQPNDGMIARVLGYTNSCWDGKLLVVAEIEYLHYTGTVHINPSSIDKEIK